VISELKNGLSTKPGQQPPGNPILRINAVRPCDVSFDDLRYLPDTDELLPIYSLRDGDLLFTRYNGSLDLLGVCGMVSGLEGRVMLYPDKLMRVRFGHDYILPAYCELFFSEPRARERMIDKAKSSAGQNGVSGTDVKAQSFAFPPTAEQREIVRRVGALFKLADAIEQRVSAATQRADKLTQAVLAKAFRGELVPTEAELARAEGRDYEPASALLERIRAERAAAASASTKPRPRRRKS
jgi:type I restriction enzyme S subunit